MRRRRAPSASRGRAPVAPVGWVAVVLLAALLGAPPRLAAEVDGLAVARREVVADGRAFGLAGAYEKLAGTVRFSLDPAAPGNAAIVDLGLAPRGADGRVHFTADFYLLRPLDPGRGNGTALVEVPNRGGKAMVRYFDRGAARTFDPTAAEDFGDGFLLRRGFTLAWVGWQDDVPEDPELLRREPVYAVAEPPLEGLVRADEVFSEDVDTFPLGHRRHRAYPVADPADPRNVLTVRPRPLAVRQVIPRRRWRFARREAGEPVEDRRAVTVEGGFRKGAIYEVVYAARQPTVVGLGLAAVRDFVAFLKHGAESPAPGVERTIGLGISQTGRFLRYFLYQGLNLDLAGRRVFDGVMAHTAGAGRGSFNHRFAQPSRDAHPFSAFFYPTDLFPFTGRRQRDPESGLDDGLFARLAGTPGMPKVFFTNTGYEYWGRAAALIHTAVDGSADVAPLPEVRIYHLAGAQHFVDRFPPRPAGTRYPADPFDFLWGMRALLVAMDAWVAEGVEPPPSRYPRLADGTLVPPKELAFPAIPGVEVPAAERAHAAYRVDYGPRFRSAGVVDRQPPAVGRPFPVLVPQVDADGNELGGVRLPEVAVPVATYAPWNWRAAEIGAPDELADFRGSFLPLPRRRAERLESGDPRRSLEERYGSREAYLGRTAEAAVALSAGGYLLAEDLAGVIRHAGELWDLVAGVPDPAAVPPAP